MKKVFSILMVAFAMTAMAACGDDNNTGTENGGGNNDGNGTEQPTGNESVLKFTTWSYEVGYPGDANYLYVSVAFSPYYDGSVHENEVSVRKVYHEDGGERTDFYVGSYSYTGNSSNGSGSMSVKNYDTGTDAGSMSFSISGKTMTLQFSGDTYTLTKEDD